MTGQTLASGHTGRTTAYETNSAGTLRFMDPESLCPDLLSLDYIGSADHLRGRVVRLFFRLMDRWPKP